VEDEDQEIGDPNNLAEDLREFAEIKVTLHRKRKANSVPSPTNSMDGQLTSRKRKRSRKWQQKVYKSRLLGLENLQSIPEKALKGRSMSHRTR
jgi:hypothetical protein